eukprot:TRINITY_DN371_c0_g3_i2.p1 TRINITY_DN371_c0_g3~~TRINITY_DN371_c0_g3_i2.p1  ORF type:complete len:439 (+),score=38.10 TRINITY_DN371_c0_g3_i2:193-1509(+)
MSLTRTTSFSKTRKFQRNKEKFKRCKYLIYHSNQCSRQLKVVCQGLDRKTQKLEYKIRQVQEYELPVVVDVIMEAHKRQYSEDPKMYEKLLCAYFDCLEDKKKANLLHRQFRKWKEINMLKVKLAKIRGEPVDWSGTYEMPQERRQVAQWIQKRKFVVLVAVRNMNSDSQTQEDQEQYKHQLAQQPDDIQFAQNKEAANDIQKQFQQQYNVPEKQFKQISTKNQDGQSFNQQYSYKGTEEYKETVKIQQQQNERSMSGEVNVDQTVDSSSSSQNGSQFQQQRQQYIEVIGSATISVSRVEASLPPPFPSDKQFRMYLTNVSVKEPCRRRGVATRLIKAAEVLGQRWGEDSLWLHVEDDNPGARVLYQKLGYQQVRPDPWWKLSKRRTLMMKILKESQNHKQNSDGEMIKGVEGYSRGDGVFVWDAQLYQNANSPKNIQ